MGKQQLLISQESEMPKPNIVLIITDHFRPDALGKATPNLNALAARGVRFEHCYSAAPLCQPARNCIITGRFPTDHGVCGNMSEPIRLAERHDTFMRHLQEEGYYTAMIGKQHYIDRYAVGMDVLDDDETLRDYGLDYVYQVQDCGENAHNHDHFTRHLQAKGLLEQYRASQKQPNKGKHPLPVPDTEDGYIGDQAVAYIKGYAQDAPMYLNVGFIGPHPPYWAPEGYYDKFDPEQMPAPLGVTDPEQIARAKRQRALFMGKVALLDDYVGKLCDALRERGMLDNTLIIFTSDHGDTLGDYGIWDKRYFYEQSVGVPLVMTGPGITVNPRLGGTISKELVSQVDLYPTILDAAGAVNILGNAKRDGHSLLGVANRGEPFRDAVFGELGTLMMVRDANWKLVWDAEEGGVQYLFNLRNDPHELVNLAGVAGYLPVEAHLTGRLLSRLIRMTHFTHDKERQRLQRVRVS
jgi:arylsulfatase